MGRRATAHETTWVERPGAALRWWAFAAAFCRGVFTRSPGAQVVDLPPMHDLPLGVRTPARDAGRARRLSVRRRRVGEPCAAPVAAEEPFDGDLCFRSAHLSFPHRVLAPRLPVPYGQHRSIPTGLRCLARGIHEVVGCERQRPQRTDAGHGPSVAALGMPARF